MPWEAEFTARATAGMLRDMTRNNAQTLGRTDRFYEVRNAAGEIILAAGVSVWSFVRPPELWLLLVKPFMRSLRDSLILTREALQLPLRHYPNLVCEVRRDNQTELRFVAACGWHISGDLSLRPNGEDFIQFKVA